MISLLPDRRHQPCIYIRRNSTDINFGIQQPPIADIEIYVVPNVAFSVTPPAGYPALPDYQSIPASSANLTGYSTGGSLSGSDPEDCANAGTCNTGTGSSFNIETINGSTKLYYDFGVGPVPVDVAGGAGEYHQFRPYETGDLWGNR